MSDIEAAMSEWSQHAPISLDDEYHCACGAVGENRNYRRHVIENILQAARSTSEGVCSES